MPSDVQDTLITILSEKTLPIPELNTEVQARRGFNIIGTANDRDRGINDLSSALRRRFNTVVMPLPATLAEEVHIVKTRVEKIGASLELPPNSAPLKEIERLVTIFRELRSGKTEDGRTKLKSPGATLSTRPTPAAHSAMPRPVDQPSGSENSSQASSAVQGGTR